MALEDIEGLLDSVGGASSALQGLRGILSSVKSGAIEAASSIRSIAQAGQSAGDGARGLLSMAEAMEKIKKQAAQDQINKKNAETMQQAAKAMGLNTEEADRLIGKRAALQDALGGSFGNALNAAQQLGGPLAMVSSRITNIASLLGRVPPQVAAILLVVAALTAAVTVTVGTLYKMGEAAIDVIGKLAMMRAVFSALQSSSAVGANITNLVQALGTKLPFATEQIGEWTKGLQMVARSGAELESMIRAVAAAQAIMGSSGASAAQHLFEELGRGGAAAAALVAKLKSGTPEAREQLAQLGLKVVDVAAALGMTVEQFKRAHLTADQMNAAIQKALQKKGKGPLEEMALTWPVIMQKAREGLLSLFDKLGPAVKPFMAAVKSLFEEFSKGGSVISKLKPTVTEVMTTVFKWATMAVNAFHDLVKAITGTGKPGILSTIVGFLKTVLTNSHVLQGLKVVLYVIVGVLALVGGAFLLVTAAWGALVGSIINAVGMILSAFDGLGDAASSAGQSIIEGLMGFDVGAFVSKMAGMAQAGLDAFKQVLGIASPSRVLMEHGEEDVAGGAAIGMDKGTARVKQSARKMGDAAVPEGGGGKGGKGSEGRFVFNNCNFVSTTEDVIRRMMAKVYEEMAGEAGAQPEGAT